ncbi:MAG TPA: lipid-A-disaccharide synthase N-terminal domain-containing protein [Rhizomicrobium sp.]
MGFLAHLYGLAVHNPYDTVWISIGFLGQAVFGVRFLIQWVRSEQEGRSVVPVAFWYCSLVGGLVTVSYTLHLQAWPLLLGQAMPIPIYIRNLWLIHRERAAKNAAA